MRGKPFLFKEGSAMKTRLATYVLLMFFCVGANGQEIKPVPDAGPPTDILDGVKELLLRDREAAEATSGRQGDMATYYGLDQVPAPFNGRIRQIIGLAKVQYKAIASSGFRVFVLEDTVGDRLGGKVFLWRDLEAGRFTTKPFVGLGQMYMQKGDAYVGRKDMLWLILYRNGEEVKFSLQ
jgi:hypothetical protein